MTARLAMVAMVAITVVGVLWLLKEGAALRPLPYRGPRPRHRITLYASRTCGSCATVAGRLESLGLDYEHLVWEDDAELFSVAGVERVPTLVLASPSDDNPTVVRGVPTVAQLRRWTHGP